MFIAQFLKASSLIDNFYSLGALQTFYRPVPYPMRKKKKITKKSFKLLFMKSQKFHGDSVTNESAREKNYKGGGRQTSPPPAFIGLRMNVETDSI